MEDTPSRFTRIWFCPCANNESTALGKETLLPPNLRPMRILGSVSRIVTLPTRRSLIPTLVIAAYCSLGSETNRLKLSCCLQIVWRVPAELRKRVSLTRFTVILRYRLLYVK